VVETLRNLGSTRLIITAGVVATLLGLFFFLTTRLTAPSMALLYSDLSVGDSGRIVAKLESMNVPHEIRGNGAILVPSDQVARLRMAIAQEGLPTGGSMGYEIFDRSESLGTSSFVLNINHLRALEGELSRTIASLNHVKSARVHLALPKRELFTRDQQEPTASVMLQMNGGRRLEPSEVRAIQNLVAAAVPKLKPSRISIVDAQGTLLARARADDAADDVTGGGSANEIKIAYEARAARTVEEMLERVIGPGRVRAEVTAEMDFDRISTTSETYDPDGQVVRSTQNVEETSRSRDADNQNNTVSVASNIPAPLSQGSQPPPSVTSGATSQSNHNEETVNYEISRTTKTHVREGGVVKRISVAVVVDGTYTDAGNGQRTYQPRSAEEIAQLTKLVKSAVGYDEARGDKVELVNLRFVQGAAAFDEEAARPLFGLEKNDYIRIAELATIAIVAILVILLVVRPLMRRLLESLPDAIASGRNLLSESAAAARPALPPAAVPAGLMTAPGLGGGMAEPSIDIQQVEGRVRESSMRKISEIVDKHPEEAVNIIRNWMYRET
jgi:flagellar M-ring protein FliF